MTDDISTLQGHPNYHIILRLLAVLHDCQKEAQITLDEDSPPSPAESPKGCSVNLLKKSVSNFANSPLPVERSTVVFPAPDSFGNGEKYEIFIQSWLGGVENEVYSYKKYRPDKWTFEDQIIDGLCDKLVRFVKKALEFRKRYRQTRKVLQRNYFEALTGVISSLDCNGSSVRPITPPKDPKITEESEKEERFNSNVEKSIDQNEKVRRPNDEISTEKLKSNEEVPTENSTPDNRIPNPYSQMNNMNNNRKRKSIGDIHNHFYSKHSNTNVNRNLFASNQIQRDLNSHENAMDNRMHVNRIINDVSVQAQSNRPFMNQTPNISINDQSIDHCKNPNNNARYNANDNPSYNTSKSLPGRGSIEVRKRCSFPPYITAILEKWLIDHIHNPYPTNAEKREIQQQTRLSILQIENWFINARRRKIKPKMPKLDNGDLSQPYSRIVWHNNENPK
jgi:3-methyladenine DNA glycosylase AlkC